MQDKKQRIPRVVDRVRRFSPPFRIGCNTNAIRQHENPTDLRLPDPSFNPAIYEKSGKSVDLRSSIAVLVSLEPEKSIAFILKMPVECRKMCVQGEMVTLGVRPGGG